MQLALPEVLPPATRPEHSLLGASGAERWMNCPGSVTLLQSLTLPESDEPDYTREGTAMHHAAAHCLVKGLDTWEITGETFYDTILDDEMAQAVQVYLDHVRPIAEGAIRNYVEYGISSPVHELFYGRLDFGAITGAGRLEEFPLGVLDIVDLKGGKGIMVEPDDNPQLKYYAFGFIDGVERSGYMSFAEDFPIRLTVVQPRGFHYLGPIRTWTTTWGELKSWVENELVPAMYATEMEDGLNAGPWCRFCPAKLACPMLTGIFKAAAVSNPKELVNIDDISLGMNYQYLQAVKFYAKALEEECFRRLNAGKEVPGTVLTHKKANRVFKAEGEAEAVKLFGGKAFTRPELKSPPEIEKLGPEGKLFVSKYAYKPDTGLTVALSSDKSKIAVKIRPAAETFAAAIAASKEN